MKKTISIFLLFVLHMCLSTLDRGLFALELQTETKEVSELMQDAKLNLARQKLNILLEKNDQNAALYILSANLNLKMGQKMLALIDFEKARKIRHEDPSILIELAQLHLENFSSDTALSMARQAVELDPSNIKGQEILILALMANTYYGEANSLLNNLLVNRQNDPEVLHLAYLVNKNNNNIASASDFLKRAIKAKPTNRQWLLELSEIYELQNKPKEACQVIEHFLSLEPDNVEGLRKLAYVLEHSLHDFAQAESVYSKILQIDPLNLSAQAGLNRLEVKQNDFSAKVKRSLQSFWAQILLWFAPGTPKQEQLY